MIKVIITAIIGILFNLQSYAQVEVPRKPLPVERKTSEPLPVPLGKPSSERSKNPFINRTYEQPETTPEEKQFDMNTDHGLLTAGDFIEKKWTEDSKSKAEYGRGQNLGSFITSGAFVEIYARDHQYVDGDRVRVFVNGKMVRSSITLFESFTPIIITLEEGFNTIEFEALNQGTSGPNTAAFKLIDDKGAVLEHNEWNLLTGAKASMIVVKQ